MMRMDGDWANVDEAEAIIKAAVATHTKLEGRTTNMAETPFFIGSD